MATAAYSRRKPGMSSLDSVSRSVPPKETASPPQLSADTEVDLLLADALDNPHDFSSTRSVLPSSDDGFDPEQALADFPDVGELGGNALRLPSFLSRKKGPGK